MRCCTWDCTKTNYFNSAVVNGVALCGVTYCSDPDHPNRCELPKCKAWPPHEGAIVKWGAPCSLSGQEALF